MHKKVLTEFHCGLQGGQGGKEKKCDFQLIILIAVGYFLFLLLFHFDGQFFRAKNLLIRALSPPSNPFLHRHFSICRLCLFLMNGIYSFLSRHLLLRRCSVVNKYYAELVYRNENRFATQQSYRTRKRKYAHFQNANAFKENGVYKTHPLTFKKCDFFPSCVCLSSLI